MEGPLLTTGNEDKEGMNVEQALERLWGRAMGNMRQSHEHNLVSDPPQKQCLVCGSRGMKQEKVLKEHIFCDTPCQEKLWGLDHFFSLGMKRGFVAVEKKKRSFVSVREYIAPTIGLNDMPDELIWELFAWAYRFRLQSVGELVELLEMRTVSKQFRVIIARDVIPSIKFLCGEILRLISWDTLRQFKGLETLILGFVKNKGPMKDLFPKLRMRPIPELRNLKKLELEFLFPACGLGHLRSLEILKLYAVETTDEQVGKLVTIIDLSVDLCRPLSAECLRTLPLLQRLSLSRTMGEFKNLNVCKGLRELILPSTNMIASDGIDELTNLTSLSIPGTHPIRPIGNETLGKFPQLRVLDVSDNPAITDEAVSQLVQLERLNISGISSVTMEAVLQLTNLVSLDMRGNPTIQPNGVHLLTNLRELYLEGLDLHLRPNSTMPEFLTLPNGLTTIAITNTVLVKGDYLSTFPNLTSLCLNDNKYFMDRDLDQLTSLRVLDLSHNDTITDASLVNLINLTELMLWDNVTITMKAVEKLPNLKYLLALDCLISFEDIRLLRKSGVMVYDKNSVKGLDSLPPHFRYSDKILLE